MGDIVHSTNAEAMIHAAICIQTTNVGVKTYQGTIKFMRKQNKKGAMRNCFSICQVIQLFVQGPAFKILCFQLGV